MKNFDLQRFGRVLRFDFVQNRQQLLWCVLGMLMVYLFFFWFAHNIGMRVDIVTDWELYIKNICEGVGIFSVIGLYIYMLLMASTLYWREQKKAKRTAWLMLPATNMEKFLSRWVYLFVVSLGGLLMFFVADAIHMAWLWMTDKPIIAATTYSQYYFMPTSDIRTDFAWFKVLSFDCFLMSVQAFFLMGGILFRKFQPIVTALVGIVLFLGLDYFRVCCGPDTSDIPNTWYHVMLSSFFVALTFVFTVLAYRLFCRWQLAARNFVNLP
jgi:hypothetical protein